MRVCVGLLCVQRCWTGGGSIRYLREIIKLSALMRRVKVGSGKIFDNDSLAADSTSRVSPLSTQQKLLVGTTLEYQYE